MNTVHKITIQQKHVIHPLIYDSECTT